MEDRDMDRNRSDDDSLERDRERQEQTGFDGERSQSGGTGQDGDREVREDRGAMFNQETGEREDETGQSEEQLENAFADEEEEGEDGRDPTGEDRMRSNDERDL